MLKSYEENGRYYIMDDQERVETTELINTDDVQYNERTGYSYHGKPCDAYVIE